MTLNRAVEMGVAAVAVNRDQRRMRVSALAEAGVVPLAAVKLVRWTATVCPSRKGALSV